MDRWTIKILERDAIIKDVIYITRVKGDNEINWRIKAYNGQKELGTYYAQRYRTLKGKILDRIYKGT